MSKLSFDKNSFYIDGKPFRMLVGDFHYFRIKEEDWARRLDLAVDFGLNTIQTYVPWNAHEPRPGEFNFEGMLDLGAFLKLCGEKGLKVLLRPAPYICSEWDLGGLPSWLLKDRNMVLRSSDEVYLSAVGRYYDRLIPEFLPYLSTNGGPIIAVTIENEYGSYGNDHKYINKIEEMLTERGVDVPLYTTDGDGDNYLTFGRGNKDLFFGVNYRATPGTSEPAEKVSRKFSNDMPFFIGEFWSGRSMHWGEPFFHRPPKETSIALKEALELGAHVSFYMFSGGTNFGFMGGANVGNSYSPRENTPARYIPHTTSYDVDALIGENGNPTEKYFLCRDVIDEYFGREKRPHVYTPRETQSISVSLTKTAELFDNLDELTAVKEYSLRPKPMEDYDQNYGLILYSTTLDAFEKGPSTLAPKQFRDIANIYVNNEWNSTYFRDRGVTRTAKDVQLKNGMSTIIQDGKEKKIDVLVENIGRVNYGSYIPDERKGMETGLLYAGAILFGYETRTIPLDDLSRLKWTCNRHRDNLPCFFKGEFDAKAGADTFVNFENFDHGYVWINGFNLGRYTNKGPQMTLYVPGYVLKETGNEIIILDVMPTGEKTSVSLIDHEILEGESKELS